MPTCPRPGRALLLIGLLAGLAACSSPEDDYRQAEQQDTADAYTEFLARHPKGPLAEQAQARLDSLAEQRDWTTAEAAGTSAAYRSYLDLHPMGPNADAALDRLLDLERRSLWVVAEQAGTREALENYLLLYPDSAEAAMARQKLAALAPPSAPAPARAAPTPGPPVARKTAPPPAMAATRSARPGAYRVQLGAFSSRARAEAEAGVVNARYARILGGPARVEDPGPGGRDRLYRLVSPDLAEPEARLASRSLRSRGQDCLVALAR